jgi:hypothetical protein
VNYCVLGDSGIEELEMFSRINFTWLTGTKLVQKERTWTAGVGLLLELCMVRALSENG